MHRYLKHDRWSKTILGLVTALIAVAGGIGVAIAVAAVTSTTVTGNSLQCKAGTVTVACPSTTSLSDGQQITLSASTATPPPPTVLLGDQTLEATGDSNGAGQAQAWPYLASTSGTSTTVSFYVTSASTSGQLGVYADSAGKPGALLGKATFTPKANSWNTVAVAGVQVTQGSTYWLAELGTGGTLGFRDRAANTCSSAGSTSTSLTALPSSGGFGETWPSCPASFYLSGSVTSTTSTTTTSTTTTTTSTTPTTTTTTPPPPPTGGISVNGNQLQDATGTPIRLHGVDRSGSEYACEQGYGIFDGTGANDDSQPPNIASWTNVNSEFVGLNEDCWLGINGVSSTYGGANYQAAIEHYVKTIEANHLYPVIGLFWEAPGTTKATGQDPMADNDHAPLFWEEVATAFKDDPNVILRLEEEPFPSGPAGALASWQCWSQGDVSYSTASVNTPPTPPTPTGNPGKCAGMVTDQEGNGAAYQAVGMQSMVNIIRGVGATNVIQIPGTWYANSMTCSSDGSPYTCGFLDSADGIRVSDPLLQSQLMADVDVYPDANSCGNTSCYDTTYAPIAQVMPLGAGETSPGGNPNTKEDQFLAWMDQHQGSYYAWAWDTWAGLISSYTSATPASPWGTDYKTHVAALP